MAQIVTVAAELGTILDDLKAHGLLSRLTSLSVGGVTLTLGLSPEPSFVRPPTADKPEDDDPDGLIYASAEV